MWRCLFAPQLSQENSIGSKIPRPRNSGWSIVRLRWFRWWFSYSTTNRFHTVVFSLTAHPPWIRWHLRIWRVRSLTLPKTVTPSHPLLRVGVEASRWVPEILKWLLTPPACKSYTHKASNKSHFYKLEEYTRRDKVTSLGNVPFSHKGQSVHGYYSYGWACTWYGNGQTLHVDQTTSRVHCFTPPKRQIKTAKQPNQLNKR